MRRFLTLISCLAIISLWLQTELGAGTLFPLARGLGGPRVVINEIAYRGTEKSGNDEWMELFNPGQEVVDFAGWKLLLGEKEIKLKGSIAPQSYFLLERTDDQTLPEIKADQIYTGSLSDDGVVLKLLNAQGEVVDQVSKWYVSLKDLPAVSGRPTMNRVDPMKGGDEAGNWGVGKGTPREKNSKSEILNPKQIQNPNEQKKEKIKKGASDNSPEDPKAPNVPNVVNLLVSRFLANPKGKDEAAEWIEIKNIGSEAESLSGWKLDNREGGSKVYPLSGLVKPLQILRIGSKQSRISLRNSADQIRLFDPSGKLVDQLEWKEDLREGQVTIREDLSMEPDTAVVSKVIDGDTIEVEVGGVRHEKVRFLGVDTPETVHPDKPVQYFGKEASDYTKARLLGKTVRLEYDHERRDEYNRVLAYVYLDEKLFNAELIQKGFGRALLAFPFKFSEEFAQMQKKAQEDQVGLWAQKIPPSQALNSSDSLLMRILAAINALFQKIVGPPSAPAKLKVIEDARGMKF